MTIQDNVVGAVQPKEIIKEKKIMPLKSAVTMKIRNLTSGVIQLEDGSAVLPGKTAPIAGNKITPFLQKLKDGKLIVILN